MNAKLEEKRKKLDEEKAKREAERKQAALEGRELPPDVEPIDGAEEVGKPDPTEGNKMGEPASTEDGPIDPEGGMSDPNRDTDTHGATDGLTGTSGFQHGNDTVQPQTTDPDVNPVGAGLAEGKPADTHVDPDAQRTASADDNTNGRRISERTRAELQRGAEISDRKTSERDERMASEERQRRTIVTDYNDDPDGEKGREAADKKASSNSKK